MTTKTFLRKFIPLEIHMNDWWFAKNSQPVYVLGAPIDISNYYTGHGRKGYRFLIDNCMEAGTDFSGTKISVLSWKGMSVEKRGYLYGNPNYKIDLSVLSDNQLIGMAYSRACQLGVPSTTLTVGAANMKFIGRVNKEIHTFHGMEFLGELPESISMLRSPFRGLMDAISEYLDTCREIDKSYRRMRRSKISTLSAIRDAYLEATFGWRPFINDIDDMMRTALSSLRKHPGNGKYIKVSWVTDTLGQVGNLGTLSLQSGNFYDVMYADHTYVVCTNVGVVKPTTYLPKQDGTLRRWGFEASRFVPTYWELLPMSWMADYFMNINQMIETLSFSTNNLRWSSQSTRVNRVSQVSAHFNLEATRAALVSPTFLGTLRGESGHATVRVSSIVRNAAPQYFPVAMTKNLKWATQVLNIAAVASQHSRTLQSLKWR